MAKMDLPPEFVFEHKSKQETHISDASSASEVEPDDAARGSPSSPSDPEKSLKRKHNKVVTFANEPDLPEQEYSDEEADEDEQQRYMKMRYKRSASLPSIELNRDLAKKIRRMLNDEEKNEEENLHRQLTDLRLSKELQADKSTSEKKFEYEFAHGQVLQVRIGDITEENVDVIVNESNGNLNHTSGVASALSTKGGKEIQLQSDRWVRKHGPVPPGQVAVTEAGQLPCKWIIHAVGPIWRGGNWREDGELWDAMWNCLVWASKLHAQSIAIPAIGTTFLGFQKERCAYLLVDCIAKFFHKHPKTKLKEIRIVNYSEVVTDAVVFEVVGKFTSGCDTSESEMGSSDFEDDEEGEEFEEDEEIEGEDEEEEEEEEGEGDDDNGHHVPMNPLPTNGQIPTTAPTPAQPHNLAAKWIPTWRRQSIA